MDAIKKLKCSQNLFANPVLAKNHDGNQWLCVHCRAINATTIKEKLSILTINEILDELQVLNCEIWIFISTHQVNMNNKDIHKTAFSNV